MAYAFAERELDSRDLDNQFEIVTGGTQPADHLHPEVVEEKQAIGIDISDRSPREVTVKELQDSEYVITMGCSADDVYPAGWEGENRNWGLADPDGRSHDKVAEIRDEIERRVGHLFDELAVTDKRTQSEESGSV